VNESEGRPQAAEIETIPERLESEQA